MLRKGVYEVDRIIGKKAVNRRVLYHVRWKGFSSEHDTWEPSSNLGTCRLLLRNYNETHTVETVAPVSDGNSSGDKRNHPGDIVTSIPGPFAKKQKLSKDLKQHKAVKATDESVQESSENSVKQLNETPQRGNVKKNGSAKNKALENLRSKIKKLHAVTLKHEGFSMIQSPLVVTKNGQVRNKFKKVRSISGKQNSVNASFTKNKDGECLPKNNEDNSKQISGSHNEQKVESHELTKQHGCGSKQKIEQLKNLLEVQRQQCESTNVISNKTFKQIVNSIKQNKDTGKIRVKPNDGDEQNVVTTPKKISVPEMVDLTKSPSDVSIFLTSSESIEISDDDDDGEDILYSLNSDCDSNSDDSGKRDSTGSKSSSVIEICDAAKQKKAKCRTTKSKKKRTMSLLDAPPPKLKDKFWTNQQKVPLRPVSPPPPFTTVKEPSGSPDNPDPSKPSGPDPVSPEASETYLADVPASFSPVLDDDDQPLSPGSMSYKHFLNSLPDQLHPGHKRGKKTVKVTTTSRPDFSVLGNPVSSTTTNTSSVSSGIGAVERRASVRASECAFRYKQIVVKKCFHFTQIWLNTQTAMKNALNPAVIQELISAMNSAKYDDSHLVLFSGFGPIFCSGTDLHYLVTGDRRQAARQMTERIRELTKTFLTFPKPIIAAVSGAAVGLGVSLLLLCDVVYASDKASFHLPYSQLSQTPEGCSSFTLPQTLGFPSANELLFGGRKITAMEAYQLGLVSQVFWPTLMMQEVIPRAQNMAASSAKALEATKLLVRSHYRSKMELTNETECNLLLERWLSVDCQHAIEAYIANEKNWAF